MKYHQQKINLPTLGAENKVFSEQGKHNKHPQSCVEIKI